MTSERPTGIAWGLSRVGAVVSQGFAQRLAPLGLTPPEAATLRAVARGDSSQRELADVMGLAPSRLVVLLDELEGSGLLQRAVDPDDRRRRVVGLTPEGSKMLRSLREIAVEHDSDVVAPLSAEEVRQLSQLLDRLQHHMGIEGPAHPGMHL